jgi:hypothetical protein
LLADIPGGSSWLSGKQILLKKCRYGPPRTQQLLSIMYDILSLTNFTQNFIQTCCSTLPSLADKMKHEVEKALV